MKAKQPSSRASAKRFPIRDRHGLGLFLGLLLSVLPACGDEAAAGARDRIPEPTVAALGLSNQPPRLSTRTAPTPAATAPVAEPRDTELATERWSQEPAPERDADLEHDLSELVDKWFVHARDQRKGKLDGSEVLISVSVRDAETGAVLADLRGERSLRPASNLKLVTSGAGLVLLGPAGVFETRYELSGDQQGAIQSGDLIVRAGGDPIVHDGSFGAVEAYFDVLAQALVQRGVSHVTGDLVLDEGDFLEPGVGPSWPSADQHWRDYCAFAAGLTVNAGVLEAVVTPRAGASNAHVSLHPAPPGLPMSIGVKQITGKINDVRVGATTSKVTVGGKLGKDHDGVTAAFRHPDPVALFASVLRARLEQSGITIAGQSIRRRGPPAAAHLITITSPISDSLVPINTHSNNSVADQLYFKLGHDFGGGGTRAGGQAAVRLALERLGVSTHGLKAVDGSGLSRDNRASPAQLTALLGAALRGVTSGNPNARLFRDSLAVMGESGTLDDRMRRTPAQGNVFAKTGFIDGTSSLAGWTQDSTGRSIVFAIMVNYPSYGGLNNSSWKPMQEAMVLRLITGRQP